MSHTDSMSQAAARRHCDRNPEAAFAPDAPTALAQGLRRAAQHLRDCQADATRSVILLPYAQLLPLARKLWMAQQHGALLPRFETTHSWAQRLGAFVPGPDDVAFDAAQDLPCAQRMLRRAGLGAQARALASRVRQGALQLASVAAAQPPGQRAQWAQRCLHALHAGMDASSLPLESATLGMALAWAGHSAYASDVLFGQVAEQGALHALVWLRGTQDDALQGALFAQMQAHAAQRSLALDLSGAHAQQPEGAHCAHVRIHLGGDLHEHVLRAAACVRNAVQRAQGLVALADTDRVLTRRIRALLEGQGIAIRDETGWKLSTTQAASHIMALLRACLPEAASDEVLAWLKLLQGVQAQACAPLDALEACLRRQALARWPGAAFWPSCPPPVAHWALHTLEPLRRKLQAPRTLAQWLQTLREALQDCGIWAHLQSDAAGALALSALRLSQTSAPLHHASRVRYRLADFMDWVDETLESCSFRPPYPLREQVVIAPLGQLLARDFDALIVAGCDETRLSAAPEPPGAWTRAQRAVLGLPQREQTQASTRLAWYSALCSVRSAELLCAQANADGQALSPSALLLELMHISQPAAAAPPDPCIERVLTPQEICAPQAQAAQWPIQSLSASACASLLACPYRFFALHMLALRENVELQGAIEKRHIGDWLHRSLHDFHARWHEQHPTGVEASQRAQAQAALDAAAQRARAALHLDPAAFVPWQAAWPRLREGYLDWLLGEDYAALHAHFAQGEVNCTHMLCALNADGAARDVQLRGRIDRIDHIGAPAQGARWLLIDYKSEDHNKTRRRVLPESADTQLAFYAALLAPQDVRAGYLNVGENGQTQWHEQSDLASIRDALLQDVEQNLADIAQGKALRASGQGEDCKWCAARGVCRRDFWQGEEEDLADEDGQYAYETDN